jgi:hypothetical protein
MGAGNISDCGNDDYFRYPPNAWAVKSRPMEAVASFAGIAIGIICR